MHEKKQFVDRIEELKTLEQEYTRKAAAFVIIYGRRRVGKTALINEFLSRHSGCNVYFLATQESEEQNRRAFRNQVAELIGNELLKSADADWLTVFKLLTGYRTEERKIIVLDEFQYIGHSAPAFPSVMQKVWDTVLKDANIMLILCGSLVTLMQQQTLDYSSPLYGRRTAQIKLKQIRYPYYKDFFYGKSEKDLIPFYAVTGGVPKYIESFCDCENVEAGIENLVLNPQSYLYEEPYFLLQNEVNEIGSYFSLIRAIAMGNCKLSEIAAFLGVKQTNVPKYLKTLMDLDLVEREVPVTESNPEKSKSGLYRITDNFISFWFKFVYPYRSFLERGEKTYVMEQIRKMFVQNYVSYIYEDLCREKMWEFASDSQRDLCFDRLGRYWGPVCGEVDLLGLDTVDGNMLIGECKYTEAEKGLSVLHSLQEKAAALEGKTKHKCRKIIIFSTSGFTKGLEEEAGRNANLLLIDTFTPKRDNAR
ncbi:MAG TPA: ATPase [Ruminococcaceae bacterium]|nr:ATPase [Oscillospiraceae bacterium]